MARKRKANGDLVMLLVSTITSKGDALGRPELNKALVPENIPYVMERMPCELRDIPEVRELVAAVMNG